ncbi:hypothetical protein GWP57_10590 [Gammaproteobacteria bacterium]|jgi:hypothetical protein|nr:hypothetical protein [Gammaproteobacteria bacterium]
MPHGCPVLLVRRGVLPVSIACRDILAEAITYQHDDAMSNPFVHVWRYRFILGRMPDLWQTQALIRGVAR